jgi:hypothetical protein
MAENMKEILKMERKTVKEYLNGLLVIDTLDHGEMGNNMELEYGMKLRKELNVKENGLMEKDKNGLLQVKCLLNHLQIEQELVYEHT